MEQFCSYQVSSYISTKEDFEWIVGGLQAISPVLGSTNLGTF